MPVMDLFPRHGVCYGALLLSHVAMVSRRTGVDDWVHAARQHGSLLAAAIDLNTPAELLLAGGFASLVKGFVEVSPRLGAIVSGDQTLALRSVAVVLLSAQPPVWLRLAVREGEVCREYIPAKDLVALSWLGSDLDVVLVEACMLIDEDHRSDLSKEIGDAAEEFVLAALMHMGMRALHVARVSDRYGYDIEVHAAEPRRLEVKAAGPRTVERFFLSRHEFETSLRWSDSWSVVQVIFAESAFVADRLTAAHVRAIRELPAAAVRSLIPPDTSTFRWQEAALLTPPAGAWTPSELVLDPGFARPGFRVEN